MSKLKIVNFKKENKDHKKDEDTGDKFYYI